MSMLAIAGLNVWFGTARDRVDAVKGASFSVGEGESFGLVGESGSGKSTLLYLIAGLDSVDDGAITVAGRSVQELEDQGRAELRRDAVGIVFQQFNLIPSLTVGDNLSFHARLARREDEAWTADLAERLGLSDFMHRYPEQLSGGQQQRVAIGRALMSNPRLLLCDEISLGLAPKIIREIYAAVPLIRERGTSLVVIEQDIAQALRVANRVYCFQEGRVSLTGQPSELSRDAIAKAYFGTEDS